MRLIIFTLLCTLLTGCAVQHNSLLMTTTSSSGGCGSEYDRLRCFGTWADLDHNGKSTREEALEKVEYTKDGKPFFYDIYTGAMYPSSSKLDIDHIVPLEWAWSHGAKYWAQEKRVALTNDPDNIVPVYFSVNRSKGSQGIETFLPPNLGRCEWYTNQFRYVCQKYGLPNPESGWADAICKGTQKGVNKDE